MRDVNVMERRTGTIMESSNSISTSSSVVGGDASGSTEPSFHDVMLHSSPTEHREAALALSFRSVSFESLGERAGDDLGGSTAGDLGGQESPEPVVCETPRDLSERIVALGFPFSDTIGEYGQTLGLYRVDGTGSLSAWGDRLDVGFKVRSLSFSSDGLWLIALGVGWNLLFVSGTSLLATVCDADEILRVQGINDLAMFGSMAVASLSAGALLNGLGWTGINLVAFLMIMLVVAALFRNRRHPAG